MGIGNSRLLAYGNPTLRVLLFFLGDASSAVAAANEVAGAVDRSATLVGKASAALTAGGKALTLGLTVPLGLAAIGVVKFSADFEERMRRVGSIASDVKNDYEGFSKAILDLSVQTGVEGVKLADALYFIASAGYNGADSLKILQVTAKGAAATLADTTETSRGLIAILQAYHLPVSDAGKVMDVLVRTVDRGVFSMDELVGSLSKVVGTASILQVPLEQLGAAYVTMSRQGMTAAEASVSINRILRDFIKPAKQASEMAQQLGIDMSAQAVISKGLGGVIADVVNKVGIYKIVEENLTKAQKERNIAISQQKLALKEQTNSQIEALKAQLDAAGASKAQIDGINDHIRAIRDQTREQVAGLEAQKRALQQAANMGNLAAKQQIIDINNQIAAIKNRSAADISALEKQKASSTRYTEAQQADIRKQIEAIRSRATAQNDALTKERLDMAEAALAGKSYSQVLAEISEKSGVTIEQLTKMFPDIRALRGMLALATDDGRAFKEALDEMGQSAGSTARIFDEQSKAFTFAFNQLKESIRNTAIEIGLRWLPRLREIVLWLKDLTERFRNASPAVQDMVVRIGFIAAAIGPVMIVLGQLLSLVDKLGLVFGTATQIIGLFGGAAGLGGLIASLLGVLAVFGLFVLAWNGNWLGMRDKLMEIFNNLPDEIKEPLQKLGNVVGAFFSGNFQPMWKLLLSFLPQEARDKIGEVADTIASELSKIPARLQGIGDQLIPASKNFWQWTNIVASQALPELTKIIDNITAWANAPETRKDLADAGRGIVDALFNAISGAADLIGTNVNLAIIDVKKWGPPLAEQIMRLPPIIAQLSGDFFGNLFDELLKKSGLGSLSSVSGSVSGIFGDIQKQIAPVIEHISFVFNTLKNAAMEFWSNMQPRVQAAWDIVQKIIALFQEQLQPALVDLGNAFRDAWEMIQPALAELYDTIKQSWPDLIAFLEKVAEAIATLMTGGFIAWVAEMAVFIIMAIKGFTIFIQLLARVVTAAIRAVSAIMQFFKGGGVPNLIQQWGKTVLSNINTIWNTVTTIVAAYLATVWNNITTIFNGIITFLGAWGATVLSNIGTIWNTITGAIAAYLATVAGNVSTIFTAAVTLITEWGPKILGFIGGVVGGVLGFISAVAGAVGAFLGGILSGIIGALEAWWKRFTDVFGGLGKTFELLGAIIIAANDILKAALNFVLAEIGKVLQAGGTWLLNLFSAVWTAISKNVKFWWDVITQLIVIAWQNIQANVAFWLNTIWNIINSIWSAITENVRFWMTAAWNIVNFWWTKVSENIQFWLKAIGDLIHAAGEIINSIWNGIWTAVSAFFREQVNKFTGFFGGILNNIINTLQVWIPTITGIWTTIFKLIYDIVTSWIKSAIENIKQQFTSTRKVVEDLWKAMVDFLGPYFHSGISQLWKFVSDLWEDIYKEVSKWPGYMYQWGKNIMQSLINGANSLLQGLLDILNRIKNAIPSIPSLPISGPTLGPGISSNLLTPSSSLTGITNVLASGSKGAPVVKVYLGNNEFRDYVTHISYETTADILGSH